MYLLRRGFFQEAWKNEFGEIRSCKMHDLIHDLAQHVAGEESIMLTASSNTSNCARHVSNGNFEIDASWAIPASLLNANRLRSCILLQTDSICSPILLEKLFANFKRLRALCLVSLGVENVPNSIGELKHLRYLNLSDNSFESLPDSVTNLLNLLTLDISLCSELKALPDDLRKLINLRCLNIEDCNSLKHMPGGIGEMSCLQYLSDFKVGRRSIEEKGIKVSGLDQLARLEQLRGELSIEFEDGISDWDGDDECWQLPVFSQGPVQIKNYPGRRIPHWGINGRANNLASLILIWCKNVKYLPPLRSLPNLIYLLLGELEELEYMEDGDSCTPEVVGSSSFFPRLEKLYLTDVPKLKGLWSEVETSSSSSMFLSFPLLQELIIKNCPQLKSIPLCPLLQELELFEMDGSEVMQQLLSNNSNTSPASPLLQKIYIRGCSWEVMHLTPPKLQKLLIALCPRLNQLHIAHPDSLEELSIIECPELESWESQDKRGVDWDSLSNLRFLYLYPFPPPEKLPDCLQHRQSLGQLKILEWDV